MATPAPDYGEFGYFFNFRIGSVLLGEGGSSCMRL